MDLGFSSHAFHSSQRLVFMDAKLSSDKTSVTLTSPPNNRVYPPGPGGIIVIIIFSIRNTDLLLRLYLRYC